MWRVLGKFLQPHELKEYREKAEVLNAYFASIFTDKSSLQEL